MARRRGFEIFRGTSARGSEREMENIQGGALPVEHAQQNEAAVSEEPGRRAGLAGLLNNRAALLVVGALLIGAVFWYLQFSTGSLCCGDYDAYYHFRWSRMLWEGLRAGHFPPSFDALPLTTLNPKDYVDHHLLFHVLWQERAPAREVWRALGALGLVVLGTLLGNVINPHFPHNIQLTYEHLL